ncbi:MAG TPA: NAD(P)-dependent oxidoreductase [Candidatus Binatia bacterium]
MSLVGIVGVGAMGRALLGRLKLAGQEVIAYDCHGPTLEQARSMGAKIASSPAALAETATIIDVVVRTEDEVLHCTLGDEGVLRAAKRGTLLLLHSTILPRTTRKVAEAAKPKGIDVMDACMVGVPRVVEKGEVTFLVGGPAELLNRARPHLLRMGKKVMHMGPLGAGNAAKLIKNLLTGAEPLLIHEAIKIGEASGIRYPDALEMMKALYSGSLLGHWEERFDPSGKTSAPKPGTNIWDKDLPLAAELGREYGVEIPITEQLAAAGLRLMAGKSHS